MASRPRYSIHCAVCGLAFCYQKDLQAHAAVAHSLGVASSQETSDNSSETLMCLRCRQTFHDSETLKSHVNSCIFSDNDHVTSNQDQCLITKRTRAIYACKWCGLKFACEKNLLCHERMHKRETLVCIFCNSTFNYITAMQQHLRVVHGQAAGFVISEGESNDLMSRQNSSNCEEIKYEDYVNSFRSQNDDIKSRTQTQQQAEKGYKCEICGKTFEYDFSYHAHVTNHSVDGKKNISNSKNTQLKFNKNETNNKSKIEVKKQQSTHVIYLKVGRQSCFKCRRQFSNESSLREHISHCVSEQTTASAIVKRHECRSCGLKFACKENLHKHESIHFVEMFTCVFCDATFTQEQRIKRHLLETHGTNDGFLKTYREPDYKHRESRGQDTDYKESNNGTDNLGKGQNKGKYCCELCGRSFVYDFSYKAHLNCHFLNGEIVDSRLIEDDEDDGNLLADKYNCDSCGKTFTAYFRLVMHSRRCKNTGLSTGDYFQDLLKHGVEPYTGNIGGHSALELPGNNHGASTVITATDDKVSICGSSSNIEKLLEEDNDLHMVVQQLDVKYPSGEFPEYVDDNRLVDDKRVTRNSTNSRINDSNNCIIDNSRSSNLESSIRKRAAVATDKHLKFTKL